MFRWFRLRPALGGEDWWLNSFMDQADNRGFPTEYAGGHWYAPPSVDSLFAHVNDVQNRGQTDVPSG